MAYSYVQYTQVGSEVTRAVTFPYIDKAHVKVRVDGVLKVQDVDYTWPTAGSIQFTVAPSVGAVVDIRRESSRAERIVNFADASILTETDLDTDSDQTLYISQEAFDVAESAMYLDDSGVYIASSNRITEVADPVNLQDVVTKAYADAHYGPTGGITDGSVTTDKIQNGAVSEAKLGSGAVTETKLGAGAVTTAKVTDSAITEAKIADLNVTTGKIADAAVLTAKIADLQVTYAKLDALMQARITALEANPYVRGVRGLRGEWTTGLTVTFTMRDAVLVNSTGLGVIKTGLTGSSFACDTTISGANGYDSTGAPANDAWSNFFLIWNGTTLSTICSTNSPTSGPNLPSGYTHWCYLATLRKATGSFVDGYQRGDWFFRSSVGAIVSGLTLVDTEQTVNYWATAPNLSDLIAFSVRGTVTATSGGAFNQILHIKVKSGSNLHQVHCFAPTSTVASYSSGGVLPNVGAAIYWNVGALTNHSASSLNIGITGYRVPNGDS